MKLSVSVQQDPGKVSGLKANSSARRENVTVVYEFELLLNLAEVAAEGGWAHVSCVACVGPCGLVWAVWAHVGPCGSVWARVGL